MIYNYFILQLFAADIRFFSLLTFCNSYMGCIALVFAFVNKRWYTPASPPEVTNPSHCPDFSRPIPGHQHIMMPPDGIPHSASEEQRFIREAMRRSLLQGESSGSRAPPPSQIRLGNEEMVPPDGIPRTASEDERFMREGRRRSLLEAAERQAEENAYQHDLQLAIAASLEDEDFDFDLTSDDE
jgi:hypothetical protein